MANDPQPDEEATIQGDPPPPPDDEFEYYKPRPNLQVWLILGGIAFVVAVAVLFIYQAGDKKTILTMQPLEQAGFQTRTSPGASRGQGCADGTCPFPAATPEQAGRACPGGGCRAAHHDGFRGPGGGRGAHHGGGVNCPFGGQAAPSPQPVAAAAATPAGFDFAWVPPPSGNSVGLALPTAAVNPATNATAQPAHCHRCGAHALALCSRCNAMMVPLNESLFYCPECGAVGSPPCPYCGARMSSVDGSPRGPALAGLGPPATQPPATLQPVWGRSEIGGGQFQCPHCNATGLPNWDAAGNPICPSCHGPMSIRGMQGTP